MCVCVLDFKLDNRNRLRIVNRIEWFTPDVLSVAGKKNFICKQEKNENFESCVTNYFIFYEQLHLSNQQTNFVI